MKFMNKIILDKADNASQNGDAVDASQMYRISLSVIFNGVADDAAGNIHVEVSNDLPTDGKGSTTPFVPTNWHAAVSAVAVAAAAAKYITTDVTARWIRVRWERTGGGTGNIVVRAFGLCV